MLDLLVKPMPLAKLRQSFHERNPKDHQQDAILKTAQSILFADWCVYGVVFNTQNGKLVGGHRRVLAAEDLTTRSKEWYGQRLEEWALENPDSDRATVAERFTALYWQKIPCLQVYLDERSHETMMIYLNNTEAEGIDNPVKLKALVSKWLDSAHASGIMRRLSSIDDQIIQEAVNFKKMMGDRLTDKVSEIQEAIAESEVLPRWEMPETSEDDAEESLAEEVEVSQGGANHNADPLPGESKVIKYPLCIIMSRRQNQIFQVWKETHGYKSDQLAFEGGLTCFEN